MAARWTSTLTRCGHDASGLGHWDGTQGPLSLGGLARGGGGVNE